MGRRKEDLGGGGELSKINSFRTDIVLQPPLITIFVVKGGFG